MRRSRHLPLEMLAPYLLAAPVPPARMYWESVFGNSRPVEIEVGFGKGLFLLAASTACPQVNFLGIEVMRSYQLFTAARLAKRGVSNVQLVHADARMFLRDCIMAASVDAVHVYFPDPWWKHRHLKRRLFTSEFTVHAARVLKFRGRLIVVTDVEDYFRVIQDLAGQQQDLKLLPATVLKEPTHDLDYLTNFERKFRKQGKPIFRGTWEKVTA